jgi:putative FmdB family regulatory protein
MTGFDVKDRAKRAGRACIGPCADAFMRQVFTAQGQRGDRMPLYAFRCNDCEKEFETLARSNEAPECPSCGGARLSRQLSLIAKPAAKDETSAPACGAMNGGVPCGACPAFGGAA